MQIQNCPPPWSEKQIRAVEKAAAVWLTSATDGPSQMTLKANQCEALNVNALAQTHTVTPVFRLPQKFLAA